MLMRSCSCSLTKMQLIHEWRRLRLPHFTPLPRWQRSAAARAHFHALYEIIESKRVSKRERGERARARRGLVDGKTRASLAAIATLLLLLWLWIIHSFLQALKIALASLVREKAARAQGNNNNNSSNYKHNIKRNAKKIPAIMQETAAGQVPAGGCWLQQEKTNIYNVHTHTHMCMHEL